MSEQTRSDLASAAPCAGAWLYDGDARCAAVLHLARWYRAKGWTVCARVRGWALPPILEGHMPVLYASDGASEVVVEIDNRRRDAPKSEPLPEETDAHFAAMRRWRGARPAQRSFIIEKLRDSEVLARARAGFPERL